MRARHRPRRAFPCQGRVPLRRTWNRGPDRLWPRLTTRPGRTVAALLDTGAARSVVARDVALSIGVDDDMLARDPPVRLVGVGPNVPVGRLHRFATLDIAGHALAAPHLIVVDRAETGMDMILGSDFLAGRRIWLSYARKRACSLILHRDSRGCGRQAEMCR